MEKRVRDIAALVIGMAAPNTGEEFNRGWAFIMRRASRVDWIEKMRAALQRRGRLNSSRPAVNKIRECVGVFY